MSEQWTAERLRTGLAASPYLIPHESDIAATRIIEALEKTNRDADMAVSQLTGGFRGKLLTRQRIREVHESNRVEGLGPEHIADTYQVLQSKQAHEIEKAIHLDTVARAVRGDRKTQDVIRLHSAKLFAEQLTPLYGQPITQVDIRNIHRLLLGNHYTAGKYKDWMNEISGSEHKPVIPIDVTRAMAELVEWLNNVVDNRLLPPVVTAAALHAWLAHIHPFDDGNGRVARLLANIIIGGNVLPPVVINLVGDRARYIDALAISDEGGDLAPLIGTFNRVLRRSIRDMRNPAYAIRLFEDEIRKRSETFYTRWRAAIDDWLVKFGAQLELNNLSLRTDPAIMMDQTAFSRMRTTGSNAEGLVVGGIGNPERFPDSRVYILIDKAVSLIRQSDGEPTIRFLSYGPRPWSTTVYRPMISDIHEVLIKPEVRNGVYVRYRGGRVRRGAVEEVAATVANTLAIDFRRGRARADIPDALPWQFDDLPARLRA